MTSTTDQARAELGLAWQAGASSGWSVLGMNLALALERRGAPRPVLLLPDLAPGVSALARYGLRAVLARSLALAERRASPEARADRSLLPPVVVHALGNGLAGGANDRGRHNVGIVFFEDTRLGFPVLARSMAFDLILAGSSWNETVLRANGITNVRTLLQGIDPAVFHPAPRSGVFGDRFVVFSGGKLEYRKGQDIVVAGFRRFRERHPEAVLVTNWFNPWPETIAGIDAAGHVRGVPDLDGKRLRIARWLADNGIPEEDVLDVGMLPNWEMAGVMREADVAVFPNRCEGGTNLVAMECMACGVPTILSDNTGHRDLVAGDTCFLLQRQGPVPAAGAYGGTEGWGESDPEELAALLERVHADREEARRRARLGAEYLARWRWDLRAEELVGFVAPLYDR